ncbi:hypothetical protein PVAP13_5KG254000 [Panicum virgatum]|uniref:Uncharacterized protein n=1 Tax=Panicum virgatum TaxID=38727 RepID=A0A8T0SME7_PANVG|nr:hypothetical protein PVAP13_5KG254000 [Panicum virgatum]
MKKKITRRGRKCQTFIPEPEALNSVSAGPDASEDASLLALIPTDKSGSAPEDNPAELASPVAIPTSVGNPPR